MDKDTFMFGFFAFFFTVVLIIGVRFMASMKEAEVPENFVKTEAVIVNIEAIPNSHYDPHDTENYNPEIYYNVYVDYTFDGKTYTNRETGYYSSDMKVGGTTVIYVNPDDPAEFKNDPSLFIIFRIIGKILAVGAGIGLLADAFFYLRKKRG